MSGQAGPALFLGHYDLDENGYRIDNERWTVININMALLLGDDIEP